ncbi:MAG TPA: hypothetical protein V6D19_04105 [Stenomitos sp.]
MMSLREAHILHEKIFDIDLPHSGNRFDFVVVYGVYGWIILQGLAIVMLFVASTAVMGLAVALDTVKARLFARTQSQQTLPHLPLPLSPSKT